MKIFLRIMMVLALGMMVFNTTLIDWEAPTEGDSLVAIIGILASGSALLLLWILLLSLKITAQQKGNKF
ncbi:MAG: hypothetical protein L7T62_07430 [Flavobacteriaceae bacterium]|nr:hypothetical protein [Flavobacteriaceae bacterium]